MKNRKVLLVLMLVVCVFAVTGCKQKSETERIIESMANIKITVDDDSVKETKNAIDAVIDSIKGK